MNIEFSVSKQCQSASGGSFVAKYRANVELSLGRGVASIGIVSVFPVDADPETVADVGRHIQSGAETVLRTRGLDANISVTNLVIHPVDCNPRYFERFTVEELEAAIAASESSV